MAYVKKTIGHDEAYIYRARFSWVYDFVSFFWLILGAGPSLLLLYFGLAEPVHPASIGRALQFISVAAFLLGSAIWIRRSVHKWTTVIAVTSTRVIHKRGFIARESQDINLNKIEEVAIRQSFWGRLFGFGRVTVRGTGVAVIELPPIDSPLRFRRVIEEAAHDAVTLRNEN